MCIILLAHEWRSDYPLIVAANRDEFYDRPTAQAAFWPEAPFVLAGRDLQNGGTWLGITTSGKLALLTNFREAQNPLGCPSRGWLVSRFLLQDREPQEYMYELTRTGHKYNGFNIIFGYVRELYYHNNRDQGHGGRILPGIHGLSNSLLNSRWPKVDRGKQAFRNHLSEQDSPSVQKLFSILGDQSTVSDQKLPDTGVGLEKERMLAPIFIRSPDYGTRSSTVILVDKNNRVSFYEKNFDQDVKESNSTVYNGTSLVEYHFELNLSAG